MKKWLLFVLRLFTFFALTYAGGVFIFLGNNINSFYKIPAVIMLLLAFLNVNPILWQNED